MSFNDLPTGEERRSPFRSVGFLAAIGFMALVVVMAVALVVSNDSGQRVLSAPSTVPGQPTATSAGANASCHLTDTDQTVPTSTPTGITWTLFQQDAVPSSPSAGPGIVDGAVAKCYAHTPLGALLAASQIGDRAALASNTDAIAVLEQQVVPGIGRTKAIAELQAAGPGSASTPQGQTAGFQFVSYTPEVAVINLVDRMDNGTYNTASFTMKWLDGDWKLQLTDDGVDSSNVSQVTGLAGYVPWGGVS